MSMTHAEAFSVEKFNTIPPAAEAEPLSDIICRAGTMLVRKGGHWYGTCPFHAETKASFRVTDDTDSYLCFACGARGSSATFLTNIAARNARYPDGVLPTREKLYGPSMKALRADNKRLRAQGRTMIHAMQSAIDMLEAGQEHPQVIATTLFQAIPPRVET